MVDSNSVQELGANIGLERRGPLLDETKAEVDMAEKPSLGRLAEVGRATQLACAADVVDERGRDEEVATKPWMQLRGLARDRSDADCVLEEAARVSVVAVRRRGQRAERCPQPIVREEPLHRRLQTRMRDLAGEELEETLELVGVAPDCGREPCRVGLRRLERPDLELEAVAKPLDAAEHADGVAFGKAPVEKVDIAPHPGVDSPAGVDELEREVRRPVACPQPLLTRDRIDPLDDALLRQLRDRIHGRSLGPQAAGTVRTMAQVKPFRALRYDTGTAGPLERLVAPPYDVIDAGERARYLALDPHNVVHLTLPDSDEQAARDLREWQREGVLVREPEPGLWALSQTYTGPDGIERTRNGLVVALRLEAYERGVVLPHERTHAGPKEGRLRLLRATRTELEPIFLLHDGEPVDLPDREPDLGVGGDRLWRLDQDPGDAFTDAQFLIADGHHRYETALAFHHEDGTEASAWMMVVLVSTREAGLTIFPTHRLAQSVDGVRGTPIDEPGDELPGVVLYRGGGYELLEGEGLDVEVVDAAAPEGVTYTPRRADAVAAVDRGEAEAAFLLRPTRIEDVFARARAGRVLPQKTTYFYPKLTSGLLFQPLD
jgi:Protein of unknown function (DUF1015)